jgi:branched-chain amino acid transport system permease protein
MIQILINIIVTTLLFYIVANSFYLIFQVNKFFHLAHAITITLGAYFTYFFSVQLDFNLLLAILLAILFSTSLGLLISQLIYKPLQFKKTPNWQMLIASLGIYIMLQNIVSMYFGDDTKSFRFWDVKEGHRILGAYITDVQIITIVVCGGLLVLSWLIIEKTTIGKQIKAVSSNPGLSNIFGISKDKAILYSFVLGSALASVAGILIAADTNMTPTMGFNWLLYAVVAMIIGGMGKMRYLFMGALLLATAQHLSAYYIDSKWMNATAYIILIVFLFFKPYGFSGKKLKKAEL